MVYSQKILFKDFMDFILKQAIANPCSRGAAIVCNNLRQKTFAVLFDGTSRFGCLDHSDGETSRFAADDSHHRVDDNSLHMIGDAGTAQSFPSEFCRILHPYEESRKKANYLEDEETHVWVFLTDQPGEEPGGPYLTAADHRHLASTFAKLHEATHASIQPHTDVDADMALALQLQEDEAGNKPEQAVQAENGADADMALAMQLQEDEAGNGPEHAAQAEKGTDEAMALAMQLQEDEAGNKPEQAAQAENGAEAAQQSGPILRDVQTQQRKIKSAKKNAPRLKLSQKPKAKPSMRMALREAPATVGQECGVTDVVTCAVCSVALDASNTFSCTGVGSSEPDEVPHDRIVLCKDCPCNVEGCVYAQAYRHESAPKSDVGDPPVPALCTPPACGGLCRGRSW